MTARELAARLLATFDPDKQVVVDTGDGIFKIGTVDEESHEVFIHLGEMP